MTAPGLCSVTLRACTTVEVVDVAARAQLTHIEWGGDVHVPHGDVATAADTNRRCDDAGIVCASYGSYLGTSDDVEPEAVVDTARALGVTDLRVWCRKERHVDAVARACELAPELVVALEFHPGTLTETAASTLALIERVGAPNLRTYWQPDRTLAVDEQRAELAAVEQHLRSLHVFSWLPDGSRRPLVDGAALWEPVLADTSAFVAYLEFVEDDDPANVERDAATLRQWLSC